MIAKLFTPEGDQFQLPIGWYYLVRTVQAFTPVFLWLSALETKWLRHRMDGLNVDRPVYICGLARAGTTIILEMLSQHPDVATHRYIHGAIPYLPYWWYRCASIFPLPLEAPIERIHRDGIMVTENSPEAMEEPLWKTFFDGLHNEEHSNVLDSDASNEAFEAFYRDHIRKLLLCQGRTRYVAKSNYSVTRMEYLLRIFPYARFLLIIRNPVNHIASLLKQNRIFEEIRRNDFRMYKGTELSGHHEFGPRRVCINVGKTDIVRKVRLLWSSGRHVQGWAIYWASIYDFVAERLKLNPSLARATLIVRYEDLCQNSADTLNRIVEHTQLSADAFAPVRDHYVSKLNKPEYYSPNFSKQELADILEITNSTAARFGYT